MELIETTIFTGQITDLLDDDEYAKFQMLLAQNPAAGALIRGAEASERSESQLVRMESGAVRA